MKLHEHRRESPCRRPRMHDAHLPACGGGFVQGMREKEPQNHQQGPQSQKHEKNKKYSLVVHSEIGRKMSPSPLPPGPITEPPPPQRRAAQGSRSRTQCEACRLLAMTEMGRVSRRDCQDAHRQPRWDALPTWHSDEEECLTLLLTSGSLGGAEGGGDGSMFG